MKLPRNNPHKYRVIYAHSLLKFIVSNAGYDFPNETGGYLLGRPEFLCTGVWMIEGFYSQKGTLATPGKFGFNTEGYLKAYKYAARRDLVLVGMYHSHPWEKDVPIFISEHSAADAHVQSVFDFPLSLVIGITPEWWTCSTWKNGYNSAIQTNVIKGRREYDLFTWVAKNAKDEFWASHLSVISSQKSS